MDVNEMLVREAIRKTMALYNNAGDWGRLEEMAGAFTPDGVLETRDSLAKGREEIVRYLSGGIDERGSSGRGPTFVRHNLTTSHIVLSSEDEARAWSYFNVLTDVGPDHAGVYIDRFRREGEDWLIAHRRVRIDWSSEQSLFHPEGSA